MRSIVALVAWLSVSFAVANHSLRFTPAPEQSWVVELKVGLDEDGVKAEIEARFEHRVLQRVTNGEWLLSSKHLGTLTRLGSGEEVADVRDQAETVARYSADGNLLRIERGANEPDAHRLAVATQFVSPPASVKPGDSWRVERRPDRPRGVPASTSRYEFVAIEDEMAKVTFTFEETSGEVRQRVEGTWWVRLRDGMPMKLDAQATHFSGRRGATAKLERTVIEPTS